MLTTVVRTCSLRLRGSQRVNCDKGIRIPGQQEQALEDTSTEPSEITCKTTYRTLRKTNVFLETIIKHVMMLYHFNVAEI